MIRNDRGVEKSYITLEELLADLEANDEINGEARGQEFILKLVSLLMPDGLISDLPKLQEDTEY